MSCSADALFGWHPRDIRTGSRGAAQADLYGKLGHYVMTQVTSFMRRLNMMPNGVTFRLLLGKVTQMEDWVSGKRFDRINVSDASKQFDNSVLTDFSNQASNLSDSEFLGLGSTTELLMPLLKDHGTNPHATLITLNRNDISKFVTERENEKSCYDMMWSPIRDAYVPDEACDQTILKASASLRLHTPNELAFGR